MNRTVSLSVDVQDDSDLPRVMEVMGRAAAGLILEGIDARIYSFDTEDDA